MALDASTSAAVGGRMARVASVPADVRIGNLLRVLDELCRADSRTRSELARLTGLGVPTVHRLIDDLLALELVCEVAIRSDPTQPGRPAMLYRLSDRGLVLAGVDVGNETTRFAVASPAGGILATSRKPSAAIRRGLDEHIAREITGLLTDLGVGTENLAAIGIGVSAAVDPHSGTLLDPPLHQTWQGLHLGALVEERLDCPAVVRQDDHFSVIAEASNIGTLPGASSLIVVEIGTGIGAAMMADGISLMGARGRFGRIASWPCVVPRRGVPRSTLGASLVAGGLVEDYHRHDGKGDVRDGASLFRAAEAGDAVAEAVLAWAGREIAELVIRLHRLCDPEAIVLGGGLARGFATLEPHLRPHLPSDIVLLPSVLGEDAVVIGALLACRPHAETWVSRRLAGHPAPR